MWFLPPSFFCNILNVQYTNENEKEKNGGGGGGGGGLKKTVYFYLFGVWHKKMNFAAKFFLLIYSCVMYKSRCGNIIKDNAMMVF